MKAVDPLVLGKARSKQMFKQDGFYSSTPSAKGQKVASFLIHGDAAFAGQGIVSETFQLYKLPNYSVGGTVHLLVNNQIGFTTTSNLGRSGNFNSDLAKGFNCPIIHVNGDDPELAWKAAQFAINYRNKFSKDVVIDLICFRKYGHNELDDPTFTNPLMYKSISGHESVPNLYEKKLLDHNVAQKEALSREISDYKQWLESAFNQVVNSQYKIEPRNTYLNKQWANMSVPSNTERTYWNTGFSHDLLKYIGVRSVTYPDNMVCCILSIIESNFSF